ncbi:MAG: S8 family serine peptidase [Muribaculaceae bacterium]|nr:S8 family serine peptidase [Muribaculaceae bacterium]
MAPDADIVFVSFGNNAVDIPNAVQYIFDYAESVNKPCVINMSLGSHVGPHNGTSTLDQYFASAVGPGRILVGAAGNEGDSQLHATKKFEEGDNSIQTLLGFSSSSNRNTMVDVWGMNESDITVSVVIADALKGKIIESSQAVSARNGETTLFKPNDENVDCYFYICPVANPSNGCPNIYVEAYITAISETRGIGIKVTGEAGQEVHLYNVSGNSFINGGLRGWASGTNAGTVGEIGGSSDDVISVGSYNTRYTFPLYAAPGGLYTIESLGPTVIPVGDVSYFSSMGPTADGRIKPDVLAPGALVVSAVSKYATSISSNLQQRVYRSTDTAGNVLLRYQYGYIHGYSCCYGSCCPMAAG